MVYIVLKYQSIMATNLDDSKENSKASEDTLHLCFPLPPAQYFTKYNYVNVNNGNAPTPPTIVSGTYTVFGDICEKDEGIIRPLEFQGIPQLFSTKDEYNVLAEMKKINHSILVNFMELLHTMIDSNLHNERELKLEDMTLLFINLHHLINEFRPHQARETLRVMLNRQKMQKFDTAEKLIRHTEKVKAILKSLQISLPIRTFSLANHLEGEKNVIAIDEETAGNGQNDRDHELENTIMCNLVDEIT